jgi:hypothetical protein
MLEPLGFVGQTTKDGGARFDRAFQWVELAWDAYDVQLTAKLDGVPVPRLLHAAGLEALQSDDPPLGDVGRAILTLLATPNLDRLVATVGGTLSTLVVGTALAQIELLRSADDPAVRARAATRLGDVADAGEAVVEALASALGDTDVDVRRRAAQALYHVGGRATKVAAPALARAAEDAAAEVRSQAILGLRQLGPGGALAADVLSEAIAIRHLDEASLAMGALLAVDPDRAIAEARRLRKRTRKRDRERGERLERLIRKARGCLPG